MIVFLSPQSRIFFATLNFRVCFTCFLLVDPSRETFQCDGMKPLFANYIRSNRTILAVAMLCFLAMKGIGFLGMASAVVKHLDGPNRSFAVAVLGAHCDHHPESGGPQDTYTHHTECCVLCSGAGRLASLDPSATVGVVVALLTPRAETVGLAIAFSFHDPLLSHSSGLFSDWSPTAPPAA